MAPVLKTGRAQALVGSNPTPSASQPATAKAGQDMRIPRGERKLSVRLCHDRRNAGKVTFDRHHLSDPLFAERFFFVCEQTFGISRDSDVDTQELVILDR